MGAFYLTGGVLMVVIGLHKKRVSRVFLTKFVVYVNNRRLLEVKALQTF